MNLLSFDLETHLTQPGLLAPPIVCGSFAHRQDWNDNKVSTHLIDKQYVITDFLNFAENPDTVWVGANIAYDFGCVLAERPDLFPLIWKAYEEARVFDVQIAASLNAIAEGRMRDGDLFRRNGEKIQSGRYSLDECVKEWLDRADAKANSRWRLSYALLENTPIEEWPADARQYPIDDAVNTLEVAEAQLKGAKNLHDLPTQVHAAFCLHLGAMWGLRTDPKSVGEFKKNVQSHLVELRQFALEKGFLKPKAKKYAAKYDPENWSKNMAAIREAVFKAWDGNPPTTDGGAVSTSRETLEDSGDPTLEKFAEVGKWEKFDTYVETLEAASVKPLNVKPNPLLSTGRVSYEGLIQLMPRKGGVRECFVARDGSVWSSVDYNFVELCTLAEVCIELVGQSDLADAINAGMDPHCILGADLVGITYNEFVKRKEAGDSVIKDIRQAGKAGNFGYPGMMGEVQFVIAQKKQGFSVCEWFYRDGKCSETRIFDYNDERLKMPLCPRCVEQSKLIREMYLKRWKEVQKYWSVIMKMLRQDDAVTQLVSGRVRGSPHGPAAANTMFQGLAADGAKRAVIALTREMYLESAKSPLYGSRLVNFSHDETILEIPEAKAHDAAMRQAEVMIEQMRTVVKRVKISAEPALMRRWYKGAKAVYVDGKLVPWEPPLTKSA